MFGLFRETANLGFIRQFNRADSIRHKVELLNGAESIGLLEHLLRQVGNDKQFIEACLEWLGKEGK